MAGLAAEGFTAEFVRRNGRVLCRSCSQLLEPAGLDVVAEHPVPGGAGEVLQAVRCPVCRASGQLLGAAPAVDPGN